MAQKKRASGRNGIDEVSRLGDRLREERCKRGRTLDEIARAVGSTKGYLSKVERGKSVPSVQLLGRVAKALDLDQAAILALAGHLPRDVERIVYAFPTEAAAVLREAFAPYGSNGKPAGQADERGGQRGEFLRPSAMAQSHMLGSYELVHADCIDWLADRAPDSVHAIVTDPPYGLKEYTPTEKGKLRAGRGGVWRIPPKIGGHSRSPVPRFTVLSNEDRQELRRFFSRWAEVVLRVLVPGGHVFIATNPLVSHHVYAALEDAGMEKRGEVIRLVQTLRGGDRPKNAHEEFDMVTVMPRSCWEPWGLFRKPCEGRVQDNLRAWSAGGLRRPCEERPFCDVIQSAPTRARERAIAPHPSLKPQALMRQLVHAALPLGEGVIVDTFMGGGSTIAAACALGYQSIGIEVDAEFYAMAGKAIPRLAALAANGNGNGKPARFDSGIAGAQPDLFG